MAREPVKLNNVVSSPGQVSNRAAYMRPGQDRSGSKALADALGSMSGSLSQFNQQVDRYQNAQRQAELDSARKFADEQKQSAYLQGTLDGQAGISGGTSLQDSPLFHQAYQEGRMLADYDRTVATMERETNWSQFNNDVDDGHNKLQAFLLEQGEDMMSGYSPELQAKMMTSYRTYANQKMQAQSVASKAKRLENMQEDLTTSLESIMVTSGDPEALRALMSEQSTIYAKAGYDNPSGKVGEALITAAQLTRDPDVIDRVLSDPEFAKTLNTDTRKKLSDARNALDAQETAIENRERAEYNRAFNDTMASATMESMMMLNNGDPRSAVNTIDAALATAYAHPDESVAVTAVKSLEAMKKAVLAPVEVKPTKQQELAMRMEAQQVVAEMAANGASDLELQAALAPFMERGLSVSNALTTVSTGVRFAEERVDSFDTMFNNSVKNFAGEVTGAANLVEDGSKFLALRETDINSNLIANSLKFHYAGIINEQEQTLMRIHGPDWVSKVGYEEMSRIHDDAEARAIKMTVQDPDSGFLELLNNPKARKRLLGSPTARRILETGLGASELARYDGMNKAADQQTSNDATKLGDALYGN